VSDLTDPNFNLSGVIDVALKNSLIGSTKIALSLELQPFGAITIARNYLYNQASIIHFEPVVFSAGTDKPSPKMVDYLQKMSALLIKKEDITLKICGYYTPEEVSNLVKKGTSEADSKKQLSELSLNRQKIVEHWLIEKGKISSKRLTTCYPSQKEAKVTGVSLSM